MRTGSGYVIVATAQFAQASTPMRLARSRSVRCPPQWVWSLIAGLTPTGAMPQPGTHRSRCGRGYCCAEVGVRHILSLNCCGCHLYGCRHPDLSGGCLP